MIVTQAVVHALGQGSVRHGVVHQASRDVDLAHGATGPGDDLGGQHSPHADFLADRDQQRVDARRVGARELGEVADPHQLDRFRVATVHLGVSLERGHEPEADRLDDRVDQVRHPPALERLDARLERLDTLAEVGDHDDPRAGTRQLARDLEVGAVDAQHQLGAGLDRRADLILVEGVDAHAHPRARSSRTASPSPGKGRPGVQPMSMMSAPLSRKYSAAARHAAGASFGALLISARISMSYAP